MRRALRPDPGVRKLSASTGHHRPAVERILSDRSLSAAGQAGGRRDQWHRAIYDPSLGRDLVATAWTSDGMVEGVQDPRLDRFVMAVQWHPELGWQDDRFSQQLFRRLVAESANYAGRRANSMADARHSY